MTFSKEDGFSAILFCDNRELPYADERRNRSQNKNTALV